jgi:transposase
MELYGGIDLGVKSSAFCLINSKGQVVIEDELPTEEYFFERTFGGLDTRRVVVEACSLAEWVCQLLEKLDHQAIIIDARRAKAVVRAKRKTDKIDARKLAQMARTGWYSKVHRKSAPARELRSKHTIRQGLVSIRQKLNNQIRGIFRAHGVRVGQVSEGDFYQHIEQLQSRIPEAVRDGMAVLLRLWDQVSREVRDLTQRLKEEVKQDGLCRYLMSVDGIGPITASTFIATIDDPHRFENGDQVAAYLGLVPRVYQSGEQRYLGRITKEGDRLLRALLVESATVLLTRVKRRNRLKTWGRRIRKKKGFGKARVAVARKLACLLYTMWVSQEAFDPVKA